MDKLLYLFHLIFLFLALTNSSNKFETFGISGLNPEMDPIYDPITGTVTGRTNCNDSHDYFTETEISSVSSLSKSADSYDSPSNEKILTTFLIQNGAFKYWSFQEGLAHSHNPRLGHLGHLSEFKSIIDHYKMKCFDSTYSMISYRYHNHLRLDQFIFQSTVLIMSCYKSYLDKCLQFLSKVLDPKLAHDGILAVTVGFNPSRPDLVIINIMIKRGVNFCSAESIRLELLANFRYIQLF